MSSNDVTVCEQNIRNLLKDLMDEDHALTTLPDDPYEEGKVLREAGSLIAKYVDKTTQARSRVISCDTCAKKEEDLPECALVRENTTYCLMGWEPKEGK